MTKNKTKQNNNSLKKKKVINNTSIIFFRKLCPSLDKFYSKFGYTIIDKNFGNKCYKYCISNYNKQFQYDKYVNKCLLYIENMYNYLDEKLWNKCLEYQYKLKGYVNYRFGYLESNLNNIVKKYKKIFYKCNLTKDLHKTRELYECIKNYNLSINEYLMRLETEEIIQHSTNFEYFIQKTFDDYVEEYIEDDILKTASQLV